MIQCGVANPTTYLEPARDQVFCFLSPTITSIEECDLIWKNSKIFSQVVHFLQEISYPIIYYPPFTSSFKWLLVVYSTTSSSPSLSNSEISDYSLEEFADELALIIFPLGNVDLPFDAKSDLRELEYLLNHDPIKEMDSILEDSVDENSPDTHIVDALSSTNNEDKVFNPGILIHENLFEVTNCATPEKNIKKATNASLIFEDFNPPLYELPFHKEVPGLGALLSFSSKNEEKVFNPGILTSKRVHTSLLPELSHRGPKAFKVIKILESPMEIFPCSYGEDIRALDVPCLHIYPLDKLKYGGDLAGLPGFLSSRALLRFFVLRLQELHIISFIWEFDIQILSTNVFL
ncbi:hypothetical protein Tco_0601091 [Tanacetum coccineum]